jgi:hypothetical protein
LIDFNQALEGRSRLASGTPLEVQPERIRNRLPSTGGGYPPSSLGNLMITFLPLGKDDQRQ